MRCRLITTWSGSTFQGLGCSPIKVVRELGSERRKTVRSISGMNVRVLRGVSHSTRGPVENVPIVYLLFFQE